MLFLVQIDSNKEKKLIVDGAFKNSVFKLSFLTLFTSGKKWLEKPLIFNKRNILINFIIISSKWWMNNIINDDCYCTISCSELMACIETLCVKIILCDLIKEMKLKMVTNSKWWHFQVKKEVSCGVLAIMLYIQEKKKIK